VSALILGTAQFGAAYGITNAVGRIDDDAMRELLQVATDGGITMFDTAADYGDAQQRLGALSPVENQPRYVSKFSLPAPDEPVTAAGLYLDSLQALRAPGLHGLLLHRLADLRDPRVGEAWRLIQQARDAGDISRIGASIYDLDDLDAVEATLPGFDLLQLPGNLVDRRLLDSPRVRALHDAGLEIHVRSVYLQGLLLADPAGLPPHFAPLVPVLNDLRDRAASAGASVLSLALGFLAGHPVADAVLVGATTADELRGTLAAWHGRSAAGADLADPHLPDTILDPRTWPRTETS
jgi:aryl-alcohol dehydrogenase-like predicted oxidoreductase